MHAIPSRQKHRHFFALSLLGAAALVTLSGCQQGRLVSPLASRRAMDNSPPSMHGPSMVSPAIANSTQAASAGQSPRPGQPRTPQNNRQVRVTSEDAIPETDIEPVEQRLATTRQAAHRAPSGPAANASTTINQRSHDQLQTNSQPHSTPQSQSALAEITPVSANMPVEIPAVASMILPADYSGVDVSELMNVLQDATPEIQKAIMARLIAMARLRAKPTAQPRSIEEAVEAAFDDLPELPTEVVDRGVNPTRIASSQPVQKNIAAEHAPASTVIPIASVPESFTPKSPTTAPVHTAVHRTLSDQPKSKIKQPVQTAMLNQTTTDTSAGSVSLAMMNTPIESTTTLPDSSLTDAQIYDVLLKRLQTSTPDESAADRHRRQVMARHLMVLAGDPDQAVDNLDGKSTAADAQLYDVLLQRLQASVPDESEADRHRRQVMARHLMVLAGDPDRAVDNLEGMSPEAKEYLRHQLLGLWTIIDPNGHPVPSRRFSSALPEIRKATGHLAAASDLLEVRGLEFCTEIEAYGQIKPFASHRFTPGQEVILYCEIENFVTASVSGGHETRLQGSYDLIDKDGRRVSSQTLPEDHQVSKNLLRDYFIAYQMYLPDAIEPGRYQLRLTMEDVHGKKYGQATVDFEIKR